MGSVMKTLALTTIVFTAPLTSLLAQGQSEIDFLRARADAHERKISQLEKEIYQLKAMQRAQATAATSHPKAIVEAPEIASASSEYTVRSGDTLSRIARDHKTTVTALMQANNMANYNIRVGQKLRIPGVEKQAATQPAVAKKQPAAPSSPNTKMSEYKVKAGDTYYSIARAHKVKVNDLTAWNPNVRPTNMRVGQSILISAPAKKTRSTAVARQASKPKSTPKPVAKSSKPKNTVAKKEPARKKQTVDQTPKSSGSSLRTITVHNQMTYGKFAAKYGANTDQLNALNGLSLSKNTMLAKGSELYVPR